MKVVPTARKWLERFGWIDPLPRGRFKVHVECVEDEASRLARKW